eukprot:2070793-Rhodomonas_salina.1
MAPNYAEMLDILCSELAVVTDIKEVSPDEDLSTLGINALMACEVSGKLSERFRASLEPYSFFQAVSPRELIKNLVFEDEEAQRNFDSNTLNL